MNTITDNEILIGTKDEIRINVVEDWSVEDMMMMYLSIQNLYDFYCLREVIVNSGHKKQFTEQTIVAISILVSKFLNQSATILQLNNRRYSYGERTYHIIDESLKDIRTSQIYAPLLIERIQINSPGFIDLTGIGTAIGHIKDMFLKLKEFSLNKKKRKIEEERMQLENDLLKIQKTRQFIDLLKDAGFNQKDIQQIVANEFDNSVIILKLMEQEKISRIE